MFQFTEMKHNENFLHVCKTLLLCLLVENILARADILKTTQWEITRIDYMEKQDVYELENNLQAFLKLQLYEHFAAAM